MLAARQKGIAEEAIVDARKDAARELRKNHENAAIELVKSLEDMKRSRREALAASLKVTSGWEGGCTGGEAQSYRLTFVRAGGWINMYALP